MNWVDILVLVVLGVTAYKGYSSGLIKMAVILFVMLIGLAFSSRLAKPLGEILPSITDNERIQTVFVFLVLIVLLIIAAEIISRVLVTVIKILPFAGLVNNLIGAGIGLLVGFVILSTLLTGLQKFPFGGIREDIDGSPLGSFMADNFDVVIRGIKLIPGDWDDKLSNLGDRIGTAVEDGEELKDDWKFEWSPGLRDYWPELEKRLPEAGS